MEQEMQPLESGVYNVELWLSLTYEVEKDDGLTEDDLQKLCRKRGLISNWELGKIA